MGKNRYAEKFSEMKFIFQLTFFPFLLIVLSVFVKRCNISCTAVQKCCKSGIQSCVIQGVQ